MKIQKIPKNAKRVFKGTVFEIYQWKQKLFDSKFRTFERARTVNGVGTIATVKNKIVVLYQRQPGTGWYHSLPGGYLDHYDENPKYGALRELVEETGLEPKKIKLYKTFSNYGRVTTSTFLYIAQDCQKVSEPIVEGGEDIKMKLVTYDQFLKLTDNPNFGYRDLTILMLRARMSKTEKSKLKKAIFG